LPEFSTPKEIFCNYAYFSSYSDSWLEHCRSYVEHTISRFSVDSRSLVVEVGSNDGYLLRYFKEKGVPVLGVEPARNVAEVAEAADIPTIMRFFGTETAMELVSEGIRADLLVGNNVLAHVPALNNFVRGLKILLKPQGVITMEFPHLMRLMAENQFDTIYHEHFSYFSLIVVEKIFAEHGLTLFDVEELPTHGGSLRIYARHTEDDDRPVEKELRDLKAREEEAGFTRLEHYLLFNEKIVETKRRILSFLVSLKQENKSVIGYGAPAKGNTLLNYCGIRGDFLDYVVDRSPHKQGLFLPGTHIPVYHPGKIRGTKPDYVVILPWNLKDEIMTQLAYIREWGGSFAVLIPGVQVH
jgi:2-polyprenyl-3-methyl-5-hydroxy-6-metoxy-1,4-benzoquinol methylase